MSTNIESQLNVGKNDDVAVVSFLTLHSDNIEEYDKRRKSQT